MILISEAISIILRECPLLEAESIPLNSSVNRILAEDIFADSDLPPFNRSQMDGYAMKAEDIKNAPAKLKIAGESKAGEGWRHELKPGEAIRIMTGAPLPEGADTIQRVEVTREEGGTVEILETANPGQFIVRRASEIKKGEKIFSRGEIINENMLASLAAFGYAKVKAAKRPKVSIMATGSEIVNIDELPKQDEIRDSNSVMLEIFNKKYADTEALPIAKDDLESLKARIADCRADILILTGGVSMGAYDFTKLALQQLGAEIFFEKVALKPGKPAVFARLGEMLIFGLPGNPVSVAVTWKLFVRLAILKRQGALHCELAEGNAILKNPAKGTAERDSYLPAKTYTNEKGELIAEALRWSGSSDFIAFSKADALIYVPRGELLAARSIAKIAFL